MESKKMYVGSGMKLPKDGFKIQLDLTDLFGFTQGEAKEFINSYKDKNGKEHKTINIVAFPMKEENQTKYRTHSVKIDDWKPEAKKEDPPF